MRAYLLFAAALLCFVLPGFYFAYLSRVELVDSQRAGCQRGITGTLDTILVRDVQADSAQAIADDPFQSERTRRARGREAAVLRAASWRSLRRVDAAHGGALDCAQAFPAASLLP